MEKLSTFIHLNTYSSTDSTGRKETWADTVNRYITFMRRRVPQIKDLSTWDRLYKGILNGDVSPSMRLLQFAGPVVDKFEVSAYNCSFTAISSPQSFREVMYLAMCGVGVGFSVEKRFVDRLPVVRKQAVPAESCTILVEDTTEGWCVTFERCIEAWYNGMDVEVDYGNIRPAGAPISNRGTTLGADALRNLITAARDTFLKAQGRRLYPVEVYDIVCFIGFYISNSGPRRVALKSLSDLHDVQMRLAKMDNFWETAPWRSTTNNSVRYLKQPSWEEFSREWDSIVSNGTGERGIYNLSNLSAQKPKRRRLNKLEVGDNPCGEIVLRDCELCNLTEVIIRPEDDMRTLEDKVELATILGTMQATLTDFDLRMLNVKWKVNCTEERLLGVSLTGICDNRLVRNAGNLRKLRAKARAVNQEWANRIGIKPAAAITTVKPSGTNSLLHGTSSGIHPRYSDFYVRNVRIKKDNPMYTYLKKAGAPVKDEYYNPDTVAVISFPVKSPKYAIKEEDMSAIEQLELWKLLKMNWTEHNPSISVYVKKTEWDQVRDWVWSNWVWVAGISFFPKLEARYKQMPMELCDVDRYQQLSDCWSKISLEGLYDIKHLPDKRFEQSACEKC